MTNITTAQIEALRTEAGEHGDLDQVAICDRATAGDEAAIAECARVIADAAAQTTITTRDIAQTQTTTELDRMIQQAAREHGRELDSSLSYAEDAERLSDDAPELAAILRAAEDRWFALGA